MHVLTIMEDTCACVLTSSFREVEAAPLQASVITCMEQTCTTTFNRGISAVRVFLQLFFFFPQNPIWEPNKVRPTWFLPTTKPVQIEKTASSAVPHVTKGTLDVIQKYVCLAFLCHDRVDSNLVCIVCILSLCACCIDYLLAELKPLGMC